MTTLREAAQQALNALDRVQPQIRGAIPQQDVEDAITTLRAALAEPVKAAMTRDDIIRMAREAGLALYVNDVTEEPYALTLERFAALVAAAEREACAKLCNELRDEDGFEPYGTECAAAIRARGEP